MDRAMDGKGSARLWELIRQRIAKRPDTDDIDRVIWAEFGCECAVMFTDLTGFSRQVAKFGILHFLQIIHEQHELLVPVAERHGGTLIKTEADSMLLLFPRADEAVVAAVEMQRACDRANGARDPEDKMILCVGIGHGKLLRLADNDVYGHEVNLASKLGEDTAGDHEILVTPAGRAAAGEIAGVRWTEIEAEYAGESRCWRAVY
jgi:adenylate cyclase